nr:reverse transcriptase domain-containing protein [Tanacetum cinerariifolium]
MAIKEVKGESVVEWKIKVTTKNGIVIKLPGNFHGYKLPMEEEVEENEGNMVRTSRQNPTLEPSLEPNPNIATIIAQLLQNILSQIVTQVTANVNNVNRANGNGGNNGCSYKTFTSCNPKEFDGKGSAVALTRWIEKIESVFDNSGCTANQRVRYVASCFVNKSLTWWNTQVQERGREAAIGMSWKDFKALLVEEFSPSNEMDKLENEFWNHTMLPMLKKGGYILWTMKIKQYLAHTDYALWEVILNGNSAVQMTKDEAGVSTEDSNQKFLRFLPSAWSNISLIMRNKPGIDNINIDYLYNKLEVYDADIKGSSGSSSNSHNVAFVTAKSTSSTNELNAAYSVSTAIGHSSQAQGSSSYADELKFSFFANQSSSVQLDNKDLEDCRTAKNSRNRSRDAGNAWYRGRDDGKRPAREDDAKALVVQDGL